MTNERVPDDFLPHRLSALTQRINRSIAQVVEEGFGVSLTEWRVVAAIGRQPGASALEVANRSGLDKVAVSRAVARLVGKALVTRRLCRHDRRQSGLELTGQGVALSDRLSALAVQFETELLSGFSAQDADRLSRLLDRLDAGSRHLAERQAR